MKHGCTADRQERDTASAIRGEGALVDSVRLGDGIAGLSALAAGSVDLVLSDLPSGATRHAFDQRPDLAVFWRAAWHALSANGVAVLMASSFEFAAALAASASTAFRYDLIWHKSHGSGFLNVRTRPLRAHEFVLVFWRGSGVYNPQMREGLSPVNCNPKVGSSSANYGPAEGPGSRQRRMGATDRYPWSILSFGSLGTRDPRRRHPQQKPVDLLAWLLRTYSAPGALVADPFAGSGSTAVACESEGRRFVGWDVNPKFGATVSGSNPKEG
jgi:site-specific DNA-methyltransferase (adenine-specific)